MPSLFQIDSHTVFSWSNKNSEPIHVHVAKGKASANATKIWITSIGGCILAHNGSHIPAHELNEMLSIIEAQFFRICKEWKQHFDVDIIRFYC